MLNNWPKKAISWKHNNVIYYSIPFTWELPKVKYELKLHMPNLAIVGGPAVKLLPQYFDDLSFVTVLDHFWGILQIINPQATKTTIGCKNVCPFCAVPKIEGKFRELEEWPDLPVLIDNNLLNSSENHLSKVMDRLEKHKEVDFNQGLDSRLVNEYNAERFGRLRNPLIRLALDSFAYSDKWEKAFETLIKFKVKKQSIRSYALIGFNSDPSEAWKRCLWIEKHGIKVLPMWYHALNTFNYNNVSDNQQLLDWSDFERKRIMQWFYKHRTPERGK